ncbi:unnamed protein product [Moneuplotes crassus]|uniref:Uncharacterized protein n=2 Tax=Euplotes crassus TaxID=5936 RepID=A0AAD1U5J8_EUPCR|nr:unnamed protein product [Moneuplotes crassus]
MFKAIKRFIGLGKKKNRNMSEPREEDKMDQNHSAEIVDSQNDFNENHPEEQKRFIRDFEREVKLQDIDGSDSYNKSIADISSQLRGIYGTEEGQERPSPLREKIFRVDQRTTFDSYQEKKAKLFRRDKYDEDFSEIKKYGTLLDDKLVELKHILKRNRERSGQNRTHLKKYIKAGPKEIESGVNKINDFHWKRTRNQKSNIDQGSNISLSDMNTIENTRKIRNRSVLRKVSSRGASEDSYQDSVQDSRNIRISRRPNARSSKSVIRKRLFRRTKAVVDPKEREKFQLFPRLKTNSIFSKNPKTRDHNLTADNISTSKHSRKKFKKFGGKCPQKFVLRKKKKGGLPPISYQIHY